jgi:hypothetical protein
VFFLGLGLYALTFAATILTVVVISDDVFGAAVAPKRRATSCLDAGHWVGPATG